ncbi:MAG: DUF4279 domain-containing protein [Saprospiraceae bacterium]
MNKTSIEVEFIICSEKIMPDDITLACDISPTSTGIKGQIRTNGIVPVKVSYWEINTGEEECDDIQDQIDKIYSILKPNIKKIKKIVKDYNPDVILRIIIRVYRKITPAIVFQNKNLRLFASLNTRIDVDVYIIS